MSLVPASGRPAGSWSRFADWLRGAALVIGFAAFGWVLLNRYTPPSRFEPARRIIRAFFRAAVARDSVGLRALVSSDEPLRWALTAAARIPPLIPAPDSALDIRGAQRWDHSEQVVVWPVGACSQQPFFITMVGEGRDRRIEAVSTGCGGPPPSGGTPSTR